MVEHKKDPIKRMTDLAQWAKKRTVPWSLDSSRDGLVGEIILFGGLVEIGRAHV